MHNVRYVYKINMFRHCIVFLLPAITGVIGRSYNDEDSKYRIYEELVDIQVLFRERQRRSVDGTSNQIGITFPLRGYPVSLELERNERMTQIPLNVLRGGNIIQVPSIWDGKMEAYQDPEHGAAINILHADTTGNNSMQIFGSFIYDGKEYKIQATEDVDGQKPSSYTHKITESATPPSGDEYLYFGDDHLQENIAIRERVKRETMPLYTVELLLVLDYTVYEYWYKRVVAKSKDDVWTRTKDSLLFYFSAIINGLDVRFKRLSDPRIDVQPVGIIIAADPVDSYWTLNNSVSATPLDRLDSLVALKDFRSWGKKEGIIPHDHAMLVTQYNLTHKGRNIQGLAFTGSICGTYRQSILQDKLDFILANVAAHELGHSLGSKHDGDGNRCDSNDAYIMSVSAGTKSDHRALNLWTFSNCSINYIQGKMGSLNNGLTDNCLTITNSNSTVNISNYLTPYLGLVIGADEQCRNAFGNDSRLCTGFYFDDYSTLCTRMRCQVSGKPGICGSMLSADGTACADNKICIEGVCSYSTQAPRKVCYTNLLIQYCESLKRSDCYEEYPIEECCKTCESFEDPTLPSGCLYGDSKNDCNVTECSRYNAITLDLCCETCAHMLAKDAGTYRDGNVQCIREVAEDSLICGGFYAGNYTSICQRMYCRVGGDSDRCKTKKAVDYTVCGPRMVCIGGSCTHSDNVPLVDCISNRYTSYCMKLKSWQCYEEKYYGYCCTTCNNWKMPYFPPGCLYGDKVVDCQYNDCFKYSKDALRKCCGTCSHMFAPSTTPTPSTTVETFTTTVEEITPSIHFTNVTPPTSTSTFEKSSISTEITTDIERKTTGVTDKVTGCKFGDKITGCQYERCPSYSDDTLYKCCGTCSHTLTYSTSPSAASITLTSESNTYTTSNSDVTTPTTESSSQTASSTEVKTLPATPNTQTFSSTRATTAFGIHSTQIVSTTQVLRTSPAHTKQTASTSQSATETTSSTKDERTPSTLNTHSVSNTMVVTPSDVPGTQTASISPFVVSHTRTIPSTFTEEQSATSSSQVVIATTTTTSPATILTTTTAQTLSEKSSAFTEATTINNGHSNSTTQTGNTTNGEVGAQDKYDVPDGNTVTVVLVVMVSIALVAIVALSIKAAIVKCKKGSNTKYDCEQSRRTSGSTDDDTAPPPTETTSIWHSVAAMDYPVYRKTSV